MRRGRLATIGAAGAVVAAGAAILFGSSTGGSIDVIVGGTPTPTGQTCDRTATTATYSAQLAAASAGQTICLAAGSYTWTAAVKSSPGVTIAPQSGAAVAFSGITDTSSQWLTADGSAGSITFTNDINFCAQVRNLAFKHFAFTGSVWNVMDNNGSGPCSGTQEMDRSQCASNICVLIDHGVFVDNHWDGSGYKARLHLFDGGQATQAGIVVQNSEFGESNPAATACANDGIQNGSNGVLIQNNYFHDLIQNDTGTCGGQAASGQHVDGIQDLGEQNTTVLNNFFLNSENSLVSFDCCQINTIFKNNLAVGLLSSANASAFYSETSPLIQHNTIILSTTSPGVVRLSNKPGDPVNTGVVARDNIISGFNQESGDLTADHNLCSGGCASFGTTGSPTFVGGADPILKYALTSGSAGHNGASDGTDIGADVTKVGIDKG